MKRIRFQLIGLFSSCLLFLAAPLYVNMPLTTLTRKSLFSSSLGNSAIAVTIACLVGYYIVKQVELHPPFRTSTYVLPTFTGTFAAISICMFLLRIDYSRYILLTCFIASVAWLTIILYIAERQTKLALALIPFGNHRNLREVAGVTWRDLDSPQDDLQDINGIAADLQSDLPREWEVFICRSILSGIPVYDVKNLLEALTGRVMLEHLSENSFGGLLPSRSYQRFKRWADFCAALVLLPVFLVTIGVCAIVIKFESRGPVFFVQERIGFRGMSFRIYKLRSMLHEAGGSLFTTSADDRITRFGRIMRKYRLDELPQIFNILKGDMSWVGPRPESLELAQWYEREIPFYAYRHAVRPGLTGWAQVNQGNVAEPDQATIKLQYDFYYTKNVSFLLDLMIAIRTIGTVLTGFGSR